MRLQLTQRTAAWKISHLYLGNAHTHAPRPVSLPARSRPAFLTWQVSGENSAEARAALRPEGPGVRSSGPARPRPWRGAGGKRGKGESFPHRHPTAAQRKVTIPAGLPSAPRPASRRAPARCRQPSAPRAGASSPPAQDRDSAPSPRYPSENLSPPPTPRRPNTAVTARRAPPLPSPQAGAALPGAGGTAADASCPRRRGAGG